MTWFTSSANRTAADAAHAELVVFVDLDLPSGHLRLHTRVGPIVTGGNTYLGVGQLGRVATLEEDAELRPTAVELELSGVDAALMTAAVSEEYFGRPATVLFGLIDPATGLMIDTPEVMFDGVLDSMNAELGQNTGKLTVVCETELARWATHRNGLVTHESQQTYYPGDRGLDQIPFIQTRVINWSDHGGVWGQQSHSTGLGGKYAKAGI